MRNRKGHWYVILLTFLIASLFTLKPVVYAEEEEIPFLELQPVERGTLQQREERELHRFTRGLEEFLQEERIVVERGVYIEADSVFEIRRQGGPTPNLPFRVSIANATENRLTLKEIRLYSPLRKQVFSQSLYRDLEPVAREIRQMKRLREEMRGIKRRAHIQGRVTPFHKEALGQIYVRREELLSSGNFL